MDDDFMTKCFEENIEAIELVLHIILNKPDIRVDKIVTQYSLKNIKGRSLRLDIYAVDSSDKKYNIEIQRSDRGAGAKRARYNSSLIDCDIVPSGVSVENLAETYVIFITENDVLGKNKPIYHIDRYIRESEEYFNDGSHIIYVNASYKDDTELGKLMHDFWCKNPDAVEEMIDKEKDEIQVSNIQKLMKKQNMSFEEVCDLLDIEKEDYDTYREMLKERN